MKRATLLDFIKKHTTIIDRCRWVSNSDTKKLQVNVASTTTNLLCNLTLSNWDGFETAEIGIGNLDKFKRELNGICGEEITCVLTRADDQSRIISLDVMDGESVAIITTSDLDIIPQSSMLHKTPEYEVEILFNKALKERFLKATAALPDVNTFTVMNNKKGALELVVGYSSINSSRFSLKVTTPPDKGQINEPLHFRADYLKQILSVNSECEDSVLNVSDLGICAIEFQSGDFDCKYYLTATDDPY